MLLKEAGVLKEQRERVGATISQAMSWYPACKRPLRLLDTVEVEVDPFMGVGTTVVERFTGRPKGNRIR